MLWIIDWVTDSLDQGQSVIAYLSLLKHHQPLLAGVFDTSDVSYYLLIILLFLGLTIRRLDGDRLQH
jgi:ABC-2 type transport system permease protein